MGKERGGRRMQGLDWEDLGAGVENLGARLGTHAPPNTNNSCLPALAIPCCCLSSRLFLGLSSTHSELISPFRSANLSKAVRS